MSDCKCVCDFRGRALFAYICKHFASMWGSMYCRQCGHSEACHQPAEQVKNTVLPSHFPEPHILVNCTAVRQEDGTIKYTGNPCEKCQTAEQVEPACDCHLYKSQCCDICQGVTGEAKDHQPAEQGGVEGGIRADEITKALSFIKQDYSEAALQFASAEQYVENAVIQLINAGYRLKAGGGK